MTVNTQVTVARRAKDPYVARGGYVLAEAARRGAGRAEEEQRPAVVLVADGTGSQAQVALAARELLQAEGIPARVVCLTSAERFRRQRRTYQDSVLPPGTARISVEAGAALGWYAMFAAAGAPGGAGPVLDRAGALAAYRARHGQSGLSPERLAAAARDRLRRAHAHAEAGARADVPAHARGAGDGTPRAK